MSEDFEFDVDFEEEILASCLKTPEFVKRAVNVVSSHHFSTDLHGWIWKIIKDVWDSHSEIASVKVFLNESRSEFSDEDEQSAAIELVAKLIRLEPSDPNASLAALNNFVRFVQIQTAGEDMAGKLERGDVDGAYSGMREVTRRDAKPSGFERSDFVSGFVDRLRLQKQKRDHPELYPVIPTGLKKLDFKLDGGIRQEELALILATTGMGKSVLAVHLGYHALKKTREMSIVHFSFEMHVSAVLMRYDTRWSGYLHKQFKLFDFTPREIRSMGARLKKIRERWNQRLQVVSAPVRSATLAQTRQLYDEINDELEFKVGLVVLDSGDHLMPDRLYKEGGKRHEHADIYWGLKAWCEEDKISMWSTAQAKATAAGRQAKAEDAGEAYEKSRIASIIISLNSPDERTRATPKVQIGEEDDVEDDEEKVDMSKTARLELLLTKTRDSEGKINIPLDTDLARMLIRDGADKE